MHVKQSQEKHSEYIRHKSYLKRLKNTSLFCPRYEYPLHNAACSP